MTDELVPHRPSSQEATKAEIMILVNDDVEQTLETIAKLKLDNKLSTISLKTFHTLSHTGYLSEDIKRAIDRLTDLLKTMPNIKNLEILSSGCTTLRYLIAALANGQAGDNLESLQMNLEYASHADTLVGYLRRNQHLKRLSFPRLAEGPANLRLISALASSSVKDLKFDTAGSEAWLRELGTRLGQCSSIVALSVRLYYHLHQLAEVETFLKEGIANMRLTRLDVNLGGAITSPIVDAIRSLALQNGALERFAMRTSDRIAENSRESWLGLGLTLRSIKSLVFHVESDLNLCVLLQELQSCESLELGFDSGVLFGDFGSIISRLPNLMRIRVYHRCSLPRTSLLWQDDFLSMVKSSSSIITAVLKPTCPSFQAEVDGFCILTRVFGTDLVGYGPTELWIRIFSKIRSASARATFMFRLLREKPELIVGSFQQRE